MTEITRSRQIDDRWWNCSFLGTFGRFTSFGSNPVDYLLTNLTIDDVENHLSFARSLGLNDKLKKDFELMMQRDVDEDRVKEEISPYLREPNKTIGNTVFFPPLLVAIVPVKEQKKIEEHYPVMSLVHKQEEKEVHINWGEKFGLNLLEGDRRFHAISDNDGNVVNVKFDEALLLLKLSLLNEEGVKLVVIDGQHRLAALKHVISVDRERVSNLSLPICIVFPPLSTETAGELTPSVPTVFRQLFVDVNSNMKQVSGHFSILLGDRSLGDLTCRKFCEKTLEERGPEALSAVEWNTKTKKEGWIITKDYSLTSIGVIWKALNDSIGKSKEITHYLLGLNEVEVREALEPPESIEEEYPSVRWEKFSLPQRRPLEEQIEKCFWPFLDKLFFETEAFRSAFEEFQRAIVRLRDEAEEGQADAKNVAKFALEYLLEFMPIEGDERTKRLVEQRLREFEGEVEEKREELGINFIRFAVFQRAVFSVLLDVAKLTKSHDVSPQAAFHIVIFCLERLLADGCQKVNPENSYTQHLLFNGRSIKPKQATVYAIANLILAQMANKQFAQEVITNFPGELSEKRQEFLVDSLHELAHSAGQSLIDYYSSERERFFRENFSIDASLTDDEKEELAIAHQRLVNDQKQVREGEKSEEDVDRTFLNIVREKKDQFAEVFDLELRQALDVPTEFGSISDSSIEDDVED